MRLINFRPTFAAAAVGLSCVMTPGVPTLHAAEAPLTATLDRAAVGAEVVLVVPSMSRLSGKIAAFSRATGLDLDAPELEDTLGTFKRQMGFVDGVDDDGALIVVVTDLVKAMESEFNDVEGDDVEPQAVVLVPTSDYAALVTQLGGDGKADATAVTFSDSSGFARKLDGYAVLGETMEAVQAYKPGKQGKAMTDGVGALVNRYLTTGDSVIYIDIKSMAPTLNKAIDKAMAEMDAQMAQDNGELPAAMRDMTAAIFDLYETTARAAVDGTDKLVFSLDLSDAGLGLTTSAKMIGGSKLADFFKPQGDAAAGPAKLLAALPDEPYLYAAAVNAKAFDLAAVVDSITAALGEGEGDDAGLFAAYLDSIKLMKDANGIASVFYAPEAAALMGGAFMKTLTVYDVADAKAFTAQVKAGLEKMNGLTIAMPADPNQVADAGADPAADPGAVPGAQEMSFVTSYTPKALVIEGTEVDQFSTQTVMPPAMMQQMGPMAGFMNNFTTTAGYIAAKDDKVLMTTVTDAQLITKGLKAVSSADGIGSAGAIANLRQSALPPDASMEFYFSLGGVMQTVSPLLMMFSPEAGQVQVPADLPPLAMGAGAKDDGVAFRMFVPTELVAFSVNAANTLMPQNPDAPDDGGRRAPRAY